jgi:NADH dehydrogenase FAD-containing subunit
VSADHSDVLLIGGGHAHVAVLADWARNGLPVSRATLLTPEPTLRYSGMVPGWISGEHTRDAGLVDLAGLAKAAGAQIVLDRCVALDPVARSVLTQEHGLLGFDCASVDVGGVGQAARALGEAPKLIDVRPIGAFVDRIAAELAQPRTRPLHIAVVGGGAGGVELAFALRNTDKASAPPELAFVVGAAGVLPGFSSAVVNKVEAELRRQGIVVRSEDARIEDGAVLTQSRSMEPDFMVAAIGSAAPDWPRLSGMDVDEDGYIAVDAYQRSTSHPHILAAGDCAQRMDVAVAHSGVHAVHTGPVLAANLRAILAGSEPERSYRPRPASLYLMSTGRGEAILSYGRFAAQGRWAARLKAWIDKRWIASYAELSDPS